MESAKNSSLLRRGSGHSLAMSVARTAIDWAATAATSQSPDIPRSSGGLSRLMVNARKIV
jgi:hypothetical protein